MSTHNDQLLQLLPVHLEGDFPEDIALEGAALDQVDSDAAALELQLVPDMAGTTKIAGWERNLGIIPPTGATLQQRQQAVVAKLSARGGLSKPYFIAIAAVLGFSITIDDMQPWAIGYGMVGFPLWSPLIHTCWRVNVNNTELSSSDFVGKNPVAVNALGVGYLWRWDAIAGTLETLFNDLRPAGRLPLFYYPVDGLGGEMAWNFFSTTPDNTVGANGDGGMVMGGPDNGSVYKKIGGVWVLQGSIQGQGYGGTSVSGNSANNDTVGTTLTWTTQTGLAYVVGSRVRAAFHDDPTQYVEGLVTDYSANSLSIAVDRTGAFNFETITSWDFSIAGTAGSQWLNGSGAPANGLGNNGDYYVDTDSDLQTTYFKSNGVWA